MTSSNAPLPSNFTLLTGRPASVVARIAFFTLVWLTADLDIGYAALLLTSEARLRISPNRA